MKAIDASGVWRSFRGAELLANELNSNSDMALIKKSTAEQASFRDVLPPLETVVLGLEALAELDKPAKFS